LKTVIGQINGEDAPPDLSRCFRPFRGSLKSRDGRDGITGGGTRSFPISPHSTTRPRAARSGKQDAKPGVFPPPSGLGQSQTATSHHPAPRELAPTQTRKSPRPRQPNPASLPPPAYAAAAPAPARAPHHDAAARAAAAPMRDGGDGDDDGHATSRATRTKRKPSRDPRPRPRADGGMRIVVPLQGVVQGRGGLVLGSLIPCALFYFFQLYIKRNRPAPAPAPAPAPGSPPPAAASPILRSHSRGLLTPRAALPSLSARGAVVRAGDEDSLYYAGLRRCAADPYHPASNPDGVVNLGLAENHVRIVSWILYFVIRFPDFSVLMDGPPDSARARAAVAGFGGAVDGGARGGGDAGRPRGSRGRGQGPHHQGARNLPALRWDTCLEDGRLTDPALNRPFSFFLFDPPSLKKHTHPLFLLCCRRLGYIDHEKVCQSSLL
jgi:hypothetical protein